MTKTLTRWMLGVAMGALATTAFAQEPVLWTKVGKWEVSIDPTIENGCYAVTSWDGGTVLRIGLNPEEENFYLLIGNDDWTDLSAETSYDLTFRFDYRTPWEVSARGLQFNPEETVYLHADSAKYEFIEEFMRARRMVIFNDGDEIDTLILTGSSRAMKEVKACQDAASARKAKILDPPAGMSRMDEPKAETAAN